MSSKIAKYGFLTAISVVIANMVGTGVFTSLGFQLLEIQSGFVILMLWAAGGLTALCGAMSYAELGAALPRSGGEYSFLSRIYHPAAGFVSGWVSSTIGFAAPTALAAITFGAYSTSVLADDAPYYWSQMLACSLVIALTFVHAGRRNVSGNMQKIFTLIKISVIVAFCAAAIFLLGEPQAISLMPQIGDGPLLTSGAFAISLIYVSFAYAGWNAATYLSGEIENPQKNLPRILGLGTLVVMILYVSLNAVFLKAASVESMAGQVEVGFIAAQAVFGETGADITGLVMASLLISTVSAMTIAGPRVLQMAGEDFAAFRRLAAVNKDGIPSTAIYFQSALALIFIITSSFESILVFAGFTVALNSFFTVIGVFVLRWREPNLHRPYRVFAFPITPLIYLGLTGWTLIYVLIERPVEGLFGLGVIASGLVVLCDFKNAKRKSTYIVACRFSIQHPASENLTERARSTAQGPFHIHAMSRWILCLRPAGPVAHSACAHSQADLSRKDRHLAIQGHKIRELRQRRFSDWRQGFRSQCREQIRVAHAANAPSNHHRICNISRSRPDRKNKAHFH